MAFLHWLMTLLRWRRRRDPRGDLTLAPELMLMISDHLNIASRLCLSLTCRPFQSLIHPKRFNLADDEKMEVLLLLEKDDPRVYYCADCNELHSWRSFWDRVPQPRFIERLFGNGLAFSQKRHFDGCCMGNGVFLAGDEIYTLPYPLARAVMNRHFYGPEYGVPLARLEADYNIKTESVREYGVKMANSWRARIIDNELMMSSTLTMSHVTGDTRKFLDYFHSHGPVICPHMATHGKGWTQRLPEFVAGAGVGGMDSFVPCSESVTSCVECLTDCCTDISWHGPSKGWVVKIISYRQFGSVRSPDDWRWYKMGTEGGRGCDIRQRHPRLLGPGMVWWKWNKADGVSVEPKGSWVWKWPLFVEGDSLDESDDYFGFMD